MRGLSLALLLVVVGCESRGVPAAGDAASSDGDNDLRRALDLKLPPGLGPAFVDEVVRACVIATGCSPRSLPWLPNNCVSSVAGLHVSPAPTGPAADTALVSRLLACAAKHNGDDCDGFHTCYGGTWVNLLVCQHLGTCHDDRVVHPDHPELYLDCTRLGGSCVTSSSEEPVACCATKPCTPGTSVCHSSTGGARCPDGVYLEFDCATTGKVCSDGECVGTGGDCPPDYVTRCIGPTVVRSCAESRLVDLECSATPFYSVCAGDLLGGGDEKCRPAGDACQPHENKTCAMEQVAVCVDGFDRRVDCQALGFKGCWWKICNNEL